MKEYLKPPVKISLDRLLLDPNNPRFAEDFKFAKDRVPESEIKNQQQKIIDHFKNAENDDFGGLGEDRKDHEDKLDELIEDSPDTNYGLKPLIDSIASIGFVPIDKPVVAKINGSDDFLVIEGNRRICSCEILLQIHQRLVAEGKKRGGASSRGESKYVLTEDLLKSITEIDVVELDLDGADESERDKRIRVILGVRHHGSLLPWEPLPSAYNIYRKYMAMEPKLEEFVWDNGRVLKVLEIFALGNKSPRKALASYVAYRQLEEAGIKVQPKWFSLIQALVTNTKLKSFGYLEINGSTFKLSEDSISKVDLLCQFENREDLSADAKENFKILRDPKSVKSLAKIVDAQGHEDETVQNFAKGLLNKVESSEPEEQIPLEAMKHHPRQSAIDALNEFLHSLKWVDQLEKLITQLNNKTKEGEAELKFDDFGGNDEIWLEKLDKQMIVFRRMYDLS